MGSIKYIEESVDQADMMAKLSLIVVAALLPYVCQSTFTLHRKPQSCADGNCKDGNRLEKRQLLEQILKEIEKEEASIEQRRIQQQQVDDQLREQIQQQLDQQQLDQQQLLLEKRLEELQRRHVTQKVNSLTEKVFEVLLDCKEAECESRLEELEPKRAPISSLFEEFALDV